MIKLDLIAGARPNFMKIGPIIKAIHQAKDSGLQIAYRLIHTGQHYDRNMSQSFFDQLGLPEPDINLGAGSGTQASQTAQIMIGYEDALKVWKPDLCLVVGDVNSTMACSIVAKKAGIKIAHVEAGIRSGDWLMPEEVNRVVTDSITDYFFTTSANANQNLLHAGVRQEQIFFVGNTMIDSLYGHLDKLIRPPFFDTEIGQHPYLLLTLHRPSNVDDEGQLKLILDTISDTAKDVKIVFPIHPRTKKVFNRISHEGYNILIIEPLPYLEFIYMIQHATGVITDSGGITEETSVLNIPCITLRNSTERPETVSLGTNELIPDVKTAASFIEKMIKGDWKQASRIPMWDGLTSQRIVDVLSKLFSN